MPTRCNRGFCCRSYCLLNMFRALLCPSSGAQEYYTVVAACGISCCGFSSSWSGVELRVMRPVCRMLVYSVASSWHFISTYKRRCTVKITSNSHSSLPSYSSFHSFTTLQHSTSFLFLSSYLLPSSHSSSLPMPSCIFILLALLLHYSIRFQYFSVTSFIIKSQLHIFIFILFHNLHSISLHFSLYYSRIYIPPILSSSSSNSVLHLFLRPRIPFFAPLPTKDHFHPSPTLSADHTSSCLSDSLRTTSTPMASQKIKTSNNYDEELNNHKQFVHNNG